MKYLNLPGTDWAPSRIALGTASFGTTVPEGDAFKLMDAFVEAGGNIMDTASLYAAWASPRTGIPRSATGRTTT